MMNKNVHNSHYLKSLSSNDSKDPNADYEKNHCYTH